MRLELPAGLDGRRHRIRRGGYPSRKAALEVLAGCGTRGPAYPEEVLLTTGQVQAMFTAIIRQH